MSLRRLLLTLLAALALGPVAQPAAAQAPEPVTDADRAFLAAATQSNLFEIATGNLAREQAASRDVRRIGKILVRHHRQQLRLGARAAATLAIGGLPTAPSAPQQAIADRLAGLKGRAFDRAFLRAQIAAHQEAIELHVAEATSTGSATLRTLSVNALPLLGTHLGMVQLGH